MADDRTRAHAAAGSAEEIHDDDELAAALAAELERIAPTGAVPVLRASAVPFGPVRSADPAPAPASRAPLEGDAPPSAVAEAPPARSARPGSPAPARRPAEVAPPAAREEPGARPEALAPRSARMQPPVPRPDPEPVGQHSRHAGTAARHAGSAAPAARSLAEAPLVADRDRPAADEGPSTPQPARIPSFSTTSPSRLETTPGRRRVAEPDPGNTQPVRLPGRVLSGAALPEPLDLQDPLRETGPLELPPTLYESWEQSLRSIGRPRDDEWLDGIVADHADPDAATVSLSRAALGPLPDPPVREKPPAEAEPEPEPEPTPQPTEPRRRRRARRSAEPDAAVALREPVPEPGPAPAVLSAPAHASLDVAPIVEEERDGVDEVDSGIRAVSAAETASVPLPPMIEQAAPVTGSVPMAPADGTAGTREHRVALGGSSLLALLAFWCGAFVSPVMLLAGFGLAAGGAGGAAAGALVLGVAVAVPAAVRLTATADADRVGSPAIAARLVGPRGGPAVAAVLLVGRLLAAAIALLAVADLAAAFVARTGVGGTSSSAASVAAVLVAGLAALVAVVGPRRTTRTVLAALAAVALVVVLIVLWATAPAVATSVAAVPPVSSTVLGGAMGFAAPGLLLTATAADAALLATGRRRGRGSTVAVVLGAVLGLVTLVLALAVGRGAGASGDPAAAFAGIVADATSATVAAPLAVALLVAALPLPALLVSTSGDAAAVLIGAGRSARLGSVAAGLLALAVALALYAAGLSASTALATLGPVLGVPIAVWTGIATLAPLRSGVIRPVRGTFLVGGAVATAIGWLLVDGLGAAGERSPVLDLLRIPLASAWRGNPALGLLVAFVLGLIAALLGRLAAARAAAPPASRLRSSGEQPVDSVAG